MSGPKKGSLAAKGSYTSRHPKTYGSSTVGDNFLPAILGFVAGAVIMLVISLPMLKSTKVSKSTFKYQDVVVMDMTGSKWEGFYDSCAGTVESISDNKVYTFRLKCSRWHDQLADKLHEHIDYMDVVTNDTTKLRLVK